MQASLQRATEARESLLNEAHEELEDEPESTQDSGVFDSKAEGLRPSTEHQGVLLGELASVEAARLHARQSRERRRFNDEKTMNLAAHYAALQNGFGYSGKPGKPGKGIQAHLPRR